jgi:hypothetical protein
LSAARALERERLAELRIAAHADAIRTAVSAVCAGRRAAAADRDGAGAARRGDAPAVELCRGPDGRFEPA